MLVSLNFGTRICLNLSKIGNVCVGGGEGWVKVVVRRHVFHMNESVCSGWHEKIDSFM